MSRMWLKNGRAVLADGRAVLCDECPCDQGCRYTYYVDHSLATSGDGHSWETAFKSVNDVFNSLEIYNYCRVEACTIYVKIKGEISYKITGNYYSGNASFGAVWLQPENDSSRVTINGESLISSDWLDNLTMNLISRPVVFDRVDFINNQGIASSCYYVTLKECNIYRIKNNAPSIQNRFDRGAIFVLGCEHCELIDCNIYVEISRTAWDGYDYYISALYGFHYSEINRCTISVSFTASNAASARYVYISAIEQMNNSIIENVSGVLSCSVSGSGPRSVIVSLFSSFSDCVVSDSTSTHSLNIPNPLYITTICRFRYSETWVNTFYNCEQYCYREDGEGCASCPELS